MPDVVVRPFNVLSLCTGAGGLDLGLGLAMGNARTVCAVEIEAYAAATLVQRMEEEAMDACPVWSDVHTFDGRPWRGVVDCVIGGYPCQPFSHAGKRRGADDPRHLWPSIARIVREVGPEWCFFENVPGHITLGLDVVIADLEGLGFDVEAGIWSAEDVGAPHRRERLYVLAHHDATGCGVEPEPGSRTQRDDADHGGADVEHATQLTQREPQHETRAESRGGGAWTFPRGRRSGARRFARITPGRDMQLRAASTCGPKS